jgi:PKD repeat protein
MNPPQAPLDPGFRVKIFDANGDGAPDVWYCCKSFPRLIIGNVPESESNDSFANANSTTTFPALRTGTALSGDVDVFRLPARALSEGSTITLQPAADSDLSLSLFDNNGVLIANSASAALGGAERLNLDAGLPAAYVRVEAQSGGGSGFYRLSFEPRSNLAPVARLSATPTSGTAPLTVSFNGSTSSDADGSVASYAWTFGDGSIGSGAMVSHTYAAGTYTAQLKVTDNGGATNTANVVIQATVPQVLAAHWKFDEGSGTIAADSSGFGNTGTVVNGATWSAGVHGGGLQFDGVDDHVSSGIAAFQPITNTFTIGFWANPGATRDSTAQATSGVTGFAQRYAIFPTYGDAYGAGHAGAGISVGTNGVSVFEHAGNYLPSPLVHDVALSGWTHIAVVYSNRRPTLYINGSLARVGLTSSKIVHPGCFIGGPSYGNYAGGLDDVRIYSYALSASELSALASPANHPPVISSVASASPNPATAGQTVTLAALASDSDGDALSYLWSFGDGSSGAGPSAQHVFTNAGNYQAEVTISDGRGGSVMSAVTVSITAQPVSGTLLGGGFETPFAGPAGVWGSFLSPTSGSAWTFQGGVISANGSGYTSGNWNAPEGAQVCVLQMGAAISQAVTLSAGTYRLSFHAAQRVNWQASYQVLRVAVDGQVVMDVTPESGMYQLITTPPFTATSGPHTISIAGLNPNGGDNTAFIDDVRLAPVSGGDGGGNDGGLVAHWTLDDGSGQSAADATGHGNTGTITGGAAWTSGVRAGALAFDGADDYVSVADAPSLRLTGDCTFALWMYKTSEAADWQRLIGKGAPNVRNYGLWEEAGAGKRILFQQYDASGGAIVNLYSNTAIEVGAWYHIAGVVSGSTVAIYINGALDASTTRAGTPGTSADPLTLCYAGYHGKFPGRLDDVRVYSRALSTADIALLLAPQSDDGLVAHWTLDDGSGMTAADATGHGNTGTITGGAAWTSGVRGGALSFDGADDYVSVPDAPSLRLTGDCTFAFWMYKTSEAADWQRLLGKGAPNVRNYGLWEEAGAGKRILFQQYAGDGTPILGLFSTTAIEVGAWYHIAGVVSGSTVSLYVNGALDASTVRAGTPGTSADPLTIGYAGYHAKYPGRLDDVRVYSRALSAAEIAALLASDVAPTAVPAANG